MEQYGSGAIVLSDICYQMGISSAQKFAFEGYVSSVDGNPRLLQRLVQTNILTGAYAVAEKYIRILEQTLFYKEWAAEWRKYLYRDDLVEEEPSLGGKRRAWGKGGQYAVSADLLEVWERLAVNNPDRSVAFQYLLSFHLLGKTLNRFDELHRKYYLDEGVAFLSIHQQEAVIALYQKTPLIVARKRGRNESRVALRCVRSGYEHEAWLCQFSGCHGRFVWRYLLVLFDV